MAGTIGLEPILCATKKRCITIMLRSITIIMARLTGLEPATLGVTGRYSNQLSYNRVVVIYCHMVETSGLEPPTFRLSGECSNQLSYVSVSWCEIRDSNS